jgi:hypothetical protein
VEIFARVERASLLRRIVNYDAKFFYDFFPTVAATSCFTQREQTEALEPGKKSD